ncbi:MAG: hypothetical protein MI919_37255, partial [Holophagales bacterium]|nr:hypothetical protein [Holophagales bacterium]
MRRRRQRVGGGLEERWALACAAVAAVPILGFGAWVYVSVEGGGWWVLAGASAALAMALALSYWLAGRFTSSLRRHLDRLGDQCRAIDSEWRYRGFPLGSDTETPAEVRRLVRDFDRMARRVDGSFERLRSALEEAGSLRERLEKMVQNREEEIRARTAELQVANCNLERLARQDALTGIANHRRFVEFADQVWR